ncbi:Hypothetical_protein [Hexamita inflata]|uniref:Hypothetical_protein n=1 Tax=Hexamita inflata TaxID=28002 RepID=A0ABP1JU16_9EUKA
MIHYLTVTIQLSSLSQNVSQFYMLQWYNKTKAKSVYQPSQHSQQQTKFTHNILHNHKIGSVLNKLQSYKNIKIASVQQQIQQLRETVQFHKLIPSSRLRV